MCCSLFDPFLRRSNTFIDRRYLFGNIAHLFELHVDGRNMDEDLLRFRPDAILILNIASYAAGINPWQGAYDSLWCASSRADDGRFREQSCSDGYSEIIGFKHFEIARLFGLTIGFAIVLLFVFFISLLISFSSCELYSFLKRERDQLFTSFSERISYAEYNCIVINETLSSIFLFVNVVPFALQFVHALE